MNEVFKNNELYSSKEVCETLKISIRTLRNWTKFGKIEYLEFNGIHRFLGKNLNEIAVKRNCFIKNGEVDD